MGGFGFTGLGTASGAGKGVGVILRQRLEERIQAERERQAQADEQMRAEELKQSGELRRAQIEATAGANKALEQIRLDQVKRANDAAAYAAELEADPNLDQRARTVLRLRRAGVEGSLAGVFPTGAGGGANTPEEMFIAQREAELGRPLTADERLAARKQWGQIDDRAQRQSFFIGFDPSGMVAVDRSNPRSGAFPVQMQGNGGQVQPGLSPTQRTEVARMESGLSGLDRIEQLFKPDYVGPVVGRARSLGQKLPGVDADPGFAEFSSEVAALRNAVIKAITGAQMSEPEARRIREQIPELSDKPEVFQAKLRATRRNQADLAARIKNLPGRRSGGPGATTSGAGAGADADLLRRLEERRQRATAAQ